MERGICPIAVFYFALKRAFFKTLLVNKDNQCYQILGHMTSSVTWPQDSQCLVSYRWYIDTNPLSRVINEILCVMS